VTHDVDGVLNSGTEFLQEDSLVLGGGGGAEYRTVQYFDKGFAKGGKIGA